MTTSAATKTAQDELVEALLDEVSVEDVSPKDKSLAEHDKEKHPDGFNPETDTCKFRERIATETEEDKADIENPSSAPNEGSESTEESPQPPKPMGISHIFTGSAANYDKPSLMAIGTGEGSQVYGWGLYGSNQRGVAETYADETSDRQGYTGYSKKGRLIQTNEGSGDAESDAATMLALYGDIETAKKEALSFPNGEAISKELEEHGEEYKEEWPHRIIYEQTFFTDRASGDESHLLKWYEPVSKKQLQWVSDRLNTENVKDGMHDATWYTEDNILRNVESPVNSQYVIESGQDLYEVVMEILGQEPRATSEFLARAGIDGVKYPVDSYGGKGVKDGDEVGWNYVSFRDDNIRIDKKYIDGQKMFDYQELMEKHHSGIDPMAVLSYLTRLDTAEEMASEFARIMESGRIERDKTVQDELYEALVEDADTLKDQTLEQHDKQHHPGGYHEGDTCKFRDKIATETDADKVDIDDPNKAPSKAQEQNGSSISPEEDAAYLEAVYKGDMEAAQQMIFEAAKKKYGDALVVDDDGKPVVFYHGTKKQITKFDPSKDKNGFGDVYFTDDPEYAKRFGPEAMACILVAENPSIHDFKKEGFSNALTSRYSGHDAAFVHGVMDFTGIEHGEVLMRNMKHIKSADPVTYNNEGNVIPLSKRFNDDSSDIRYSQGEGKGKPVFAEGEKEELEKTAKEVERFIPGVKVKISPKPFSPNGDPEERKSVKAREIRRWRNFINMFTMGGMPVTKGPKGKINDTTYDDHLVLEHTPVVLQRLGVPDRPIGVSGEILQKILGLRSTKHNIWHKTTIKDIYTMLSELDNPIAVFAHESEPDKIVVLTRMIDQLSEDYDNDVIALAVDTKSQHKVPAHIIATGFGEHKGGVRRWVQNGLLLYANKELLKTTPWLHIPESEFDRPDLLTEKDFANDNLGKIERDPPIPEPDPHIRLFLDDWGAVVGTYNRKTNEVTLYPGANADTISHELCGHATWQYAEQQAAKGDKTLLDKMNEVVDSETAKPVWEEVAANYGGENHDVQREEVWAHIVGHKGSEAIAQIRKTEKGQKWYQKAWGVVKDAWKGLMSAVGLNRIKTDGIERMSPEEFSDYMVEQMTSGKTLGKLDKTDGDGERKSIIGQKGAKNLGIGGLKEAKQMEKSGADRKAIWKKTGWWKGKDGKWRVEIPDVKFPKTIRKEIKESKGNISEIPLRTILDDWGDDELAFDWQESKPSDFKSQILRAYPTLKKLKVRMFSGKSPHNPYEWGRYDAYRNEICLYRVKPSNITEIERRFTHELQHAIQKAEGLSFGADSDDWEAYWNSEGEVEARNTQKRFGPNNKKKAPWETEDVPEEKQITEKQRNRAAGRSRRGIIPNTHKGATLMSLMAKNHPEVEATELVERLASLDSQEEMEHEIQKFLGESK